MKLLGIKVGDHDVNFSFFDGKKVFYYKKERETQIKHDGDIDPLYWVNVIKKWGYNSSEIDAICVTGDEELFRETLDPTIHFHKIKSDNWFPGLNCEVYRLDHHLAHALSIWPVTDKKPTKNFVFDGDGDFQRSYSIFTDMTLVDSMSVKECQSFGQILQSISKINNIEGLDLDLPGKAMGLKSYGIPNSNYLKLFEDGELTDLNKVFNLKIWESVSEFDTPLNLLSTIHKFGEEKFPQFFEKFSSSQDHISFSGGVAQNSVINGLLQKKFPNLIIPPHCGDEGLSLGCLEFLRILYELPEFKIQNFPFIQSDESTENVSEENIKKVSDLLCKGKIVGWYQGHGEIGPRALGNRSILMDATVKNGKNIINERIKHREWYRPFGCSILKGKQKEFFDVSYESPYMLHVSTMKKNEYESITHIDNTTRFQTVDENNKSFLDLLEKFYEMSGHPLLLNTSLNLNKFPICSTKKQALKIFQETEMDAICIGNDLIIK